MVTPVSTVLFGSEPLHPGHDRGYRGRPVASRHGRPERHERMATRLALPVPRPPSPDRQLELHHRLEPVDVGAIEQADFD